MVVQSGGPEVLDGHAEVLQPTLSFVAFGTASGAIAGTLFQHPHQFAGLAFQAFRLVRFAGFLGPALGRLQLLQPSLHAFAVGHRRLQFAQLDFNAFQSALQLPCLGVLIGLQRFQLTTDLRGLLLQMASTLRQLTGLGFPFFAAFPAWFALPTSFRFPLLTFFTSFARFAFPLLLHRPPLAAFPFRLHRRTLAALPVDFDERHVMLPFCREGPGSVSRGGT